MSPGGNNLKQVIMSWHIEPFWPFLRTRDYLAPQVVNRLDAETDHIVDLAGDPTKDGVWNRRGMVIGHVQSGKTQNYSAGNLQKRLTLDTR